MRRLLAVLATAVVLATVGAAGPAAARPPVESPVPGLPVYLAVGDSVALGQNSAPDPADWPTFGYAGQLADRLVAELDCLPAASAAARDGCRALQYLNIARTAIPGGPGGVTTAALLAEQMPVATALLAARNGDASPRNDVEVVTLTVGGNDLFGPVIRACVPAVPPVGCAAAVQTVLADVAANYETILAGLRAAGGADLRIVTTTYYNPLGACFLGQQVPAWVALAEVVLEGGAVAGLGSLPAGLNDVIRAASARHGAAVADTYGRLGPADLVGGPDCLHPNRAGHTVIAGIAAAAATG